MVKISAQKCKKKIETTFSEFLLTVGLMAMNIITCIFCKCCIPSTRGTQDKYVEHLQVIELFYFLPLS